jgi:hypothetical protein
LGELLEGNFTSSSYGRNWKRAQPQGPAPRQFLTRQRDYQKLKQEVRLVHFEGRGWRGFHHHATLSIAAYGFLVSAKETIPPRRLVPPRCSRNLPLPMVTDPEAPPLRTERHVPNSIATMHQRLIVRLCHDARAVYQSYVATVESGQRRIDAVEFLDFAEAIGFDPKSAIRRLTSTKSQ